MQVLPVKIRVLVEDRFQNVKSVDAITFFLWVQAHHVSNNDDFKHSAANEYNTSFQLLSTKKRIAWYAYKHMKLYIPLLFIWLV